MSVPTLYDLAQRIANCPPEDGEARRELLEEIKGVRKGWKNRTESELGGCLDAVVSLLAFLDELDGAAISEALQISSRLVCLTAEGFGEEPLNTEPYSAPPRFAVANMAGPSKTPAYQQDSLLGEVLVKLQHVTPDDVQRALIEQRRSGTRLGEALIHIGATEFPMVQEGIEVQARLRSVGGPPRLQVREYASTPAVSPKETKLRLATDSRLGEILMNQGSVNAHSLEEAILVQRATGIRLGEALVQNGKITWEQLEIALRVQSQTRRS